MDVVETDWMTHVRETERNDKDPRRHKRKTRKDQNRYISDASAMRLDEKAGEIANRRDTRASLPTRSNLRVCMVHFIITCSPFYVHSICHR